MAGSASIFLNYVSSLLNIFIGKTVLTRGVFAASEIERPYLGVSEILTFFYIYLSMRPKVGICQILDSIFGDNFHNDDIKIYW